MPGDGFHQQMADEMHKLVPRMRGDRPAHAVDLDFDLCGCSAYAGNSVVATAMKHAWSSKLRLAKETLAKCKKPLTS